VGGNGTITGGAVEQSNVNLSTEFSNMIVAQQNYEANAKALTTLDQVSQATIQMIT
jgi:flagellar hook protein FlgE